MKYQANDSGIMSYMFFIMLLLQLSLITLLLTFETVYSSIAANEKVRLTRNF